MSERNQEVPFELGPALNFLRKIWRLNHAVERASQHMDRTLGMTAQQRFLLRCIGRFPGITPGEVAIALHLHPGTISSTIRRLESKGLVRRQRDTVDSRRMSLGLTAKGRLFDVPASSSVEAAVESLMKTTPHEKLEHTSAVLDKLSEILSETATQES